MKGRIQFVSKGSFDFAFDWDKLVVEPASKGYFIEAFGSADALLDDSLDFLLKAIYSDSKSRHLIYGLLSLRGRTRFYGLVIAEILKSQGVIDAALFTKIKRWKEVRNSVAHDKYGEYALGIANGKTAANNQKEFDKLVEDTANKWLKEAREIDTRLAMLIPK